MPTPVKFNHLSNKYEPEYKLEGAIIIENPTKALFFNKTIPLHITMSFCLFVSILLIIIKKKYMTKSNNK